MHQDLVSLLPHSSQPLAQGSHPSCLRAGLAGVQTKKPSQFPCWGACPLICPSSLPQGIPSTLEKAPSGASTEIRSGMRGAQGSTDTQRVQSSCPFLSAPLPVYLASFLPHLPVHPKPHLLLMKDALWPLRMESQTTCLQTLGTQRPSPTES